MYKHNTITYTARNETSSCMLTTQNRTRRKARNIPEQLPDRLDSAWLYFYCLLHFSYTYLFHRSALSNVCALCNLQEAKQLSEQILRFIYDIHVPDKSYRWTYEMTDGHDARKLQNSTNKALFNAAQYIRTVPCYIQHQCQASVHPDFYHCQHTLLHCHQTLQGTLHHRPLHCPSHIQMVATSE